MYTKKQLQKTIDKINSDLRDIQLDAKESDCIIDIRLETDSHDYPYFKLIFNDDEY
jgi:hypothetical protein